jgi:hypothetical protein
VPVAAAVPPLSVGDHVEAVMTSDVGFGAEVAEAVVVAVGDDAVTVAASRADAEDIAAGIVTGVVTLTLVGAEP